MGHRLGPSPLPSAAPVTCPSAIGISSLRDCSWVPSDATLPFLPSVQKKMVAFSLSQS